MLPTPSVSHLLRAGLNDDSLNACLQLNANNRRRKDIHTLPLADRELLDSLRYKERISAADHAILKNAEFLNLVIANPAIFGHDEDEDDPQLKRNDQDEDDSDEDECADDNTGPSHSMLRLN